jgi:hypothetical protein
MKKTIMLIAAVFVVNATSFAQAKEAPKCDVRAYFGTFTATSSVTKAELTSVNGLTAKNNCDDKASYVVVSFEFTAAKSEKDFIALKGTSAAFTDEMKTALKGMSAGQKVFLDNVTAKTADGSLKKIPGITLKIK